MGLRFYRPDMPSAALHPGLLHPARNQPTEIGVEGVYRQVHCMMPRHYSMHCEWLGNDRDSGCSPEVRFVNMPNSSNHKVVEFDHFKFGALNLHGISPSTRKLSAGMKKFHPASSTTTHRKTYTTRRPKTYCRQKLLPVVNPNA